MANIVRQFGKNIFTSWASVGVRVLIVFFVNPFIIHTLGDDRYGVWMLVISIINYMTILDFGIKQALIRFISKYLGKDDYSRINSYLNTSFLIYLVIALIVITAAVILSFFSLGLFQIPVSMMSDARLVLIIIGISTAINFLFITWSESLGAFHRYDVFYGLIIGEEIFRTVLIIWLLKNGYGLVPFALAYLIFNLLRNLIASGILKRLFSKIEFSFRHINRPAYRELIGFGFIGFLISIAWLLIANTDNVLIGYFLNTTAVTKYAIAGGFIAYLRTLILAVSFPLRPLISHYEASGGLDKIRFIFMAGTKYMTFITFLAAGITMVLADDFILLWLGPGYEMSALILKILVIPAAIYLPQTVAGSILYGVEKHKYLLLLILCEGVMNLILSVILVRDYGMVGIAIGTIIPQVLIYLVLMPAVIRKIINYNMIAYYRSILFSGGLAFAVSFVIARLGGEFIGTETWAEFLSVSAIAIAVTSALGYLFRNRSEFSSIYKKIRSTSN